jgi:hypothetical protein
MVRGRIHAQHQIAGTDRIAHGFIPSLDGKIDPDEQLGKALPSLSPA